MTRLQNKGLRRRETWTPPRKAKWKPNTVRSRGTEIPMPGKKRRISKEQQYALGIANLMLVGPRMRQRMWELGFIKDKTIPKVQSSQFYLVNYRKTKNNARCSISNVFGRPMTIWSISTGMIPKGSKVSKTRSFRKTRFAQNLMLTKVVAKLKRIGCKFLVIHCSSTTASKRYLFRTFHKTFKIVLLKDFTGIPHNGCRSPSIRRL
jgi:ribosomal protein S11